MSKNKNLALRRMVLTRYEMIIIVHAAVLLLDCHLCHALIDFC